MVFVEAIKSIIASSSHNLDFLRYALLEVGEFLASSAFDYKLSSNLTADEFRNEVKTLHLFVINEIQYQLPNLGFKELMIGLFLSKSELFLPRYTPDLQKLGIKNNANGFREQPDETTKRVSKLTRILAGLLSDDAYIGRLWQLLCALFEVRHNWLHPYIVLGILETAGEELLRAYRAPMRALLIRMLNPQNGYIDQIRQYLSSNDFLNEPQNQDQVLDPTWEKNSRSLGQADALTKVQDLLDIVQRLMTL